MISDVKYRQDLIQKIYDKMYQEYQDKPYDLQNLLMDYAQEINKEREKQKKQTSWVNYSNDKQFLNLDYNDNPYINENNIKQYLRTLTIEELSIIGGDFGIPHPSFLEIVKDVIKIDINKHIKSQFQDAIKNAKDNPDNAIEEARSATIKFIKKYLNDETINKDNLKEKIQQFLKDKKILQENMANGNPEIRNICSRLISMGNDIEMIRKTITDAHVENCIKDENLAVFIINCLASVCYFFDNIDSNTNENKIEETNEINDINGDIPF